MIFKQRKGVTLDSTIFTDKAYQKPLICPFCQITTEGQLVGVGRVPFEIGKNLFVFSLKCAYCDNSFVALYLDDPGDRQNLHFINTLPANPQKGRSDSLQALSKDFISFDLQAQKAESADLISLAAIGYHIALEALLKAFAEKELLISPPTLALQNLKDCIALYLKQEELIKSPEVNRLFGNDCTYYNQALTREDFSSFKYYYNIFIQVVQTQLAILHPLIEK